MRSLHLSGRYIIGPSRLADNLPIEFHANSTMGVELIHGEVDDGRHEAEQDQEAPVSAIHGRIGL